MKRRIVTLTLAAALVIAGVQFAGCRRLASVTNPGTGTPVVVTVVIKAAQPGLETQFKTGDVIRVKGSGNTVGKITSVTTSATLDPVGTADGRLVAAVVPNQEDITLKISGTAVPGDDGYRFDGERVWVNQDVGMISRLVSFTGTVLGIEETGK